MLNNTHMEFLIQDRYAVVSAIFSGNVCSEFMTSETPGHFTTPAHIVRKIILCLSGGVDPIDWTVNYSGPYENYGFEKYLYD